jgi:hypothetical protein
MQNKVSETNVNEPKDENNRSFFSVTDRDSSYETFLSNIQCCNIPSYLLGHPEDNFSTDDDDPRR